MGGGGHPRNQTGVEGVWGEPEFTPLWFKAANGVLKKSAVVRLIRHYHFTKFAKIQSGLHAEKIDDYLTHIIWGGKFGQAGLPELSVKLGEL